MKRFRGFLTGKKPSGSTETKAKLKRTINQMEVKIRNYQRQADEQYELARTLLKSGNKVGAQQALKRRELYLTQVSNTHNKIANLQRTIDTLDVSADNVALTDTLASAQTAIDANIEAASPERTEEVMMELEESIEMVSGMEEALTDTSITEIGMDVEVDDRISKQMAELEAELTTGSLPATSVETSEPIPPVTETATPAKREADKKKLDEMRRQIEEGLRS
ncbi:MAG: Snf7 family protein [Candidatus Heimdallarchaeota archaeon]|nr:MAG: Snf7 family protein [Candidatus Heimdallarchaeota archaeon]